MASDTPDTTAPKQAQERGTGRWSKGTSGNPAGRTKGARHVALQALDAIGSEGAEDVLRMVVELAKAGDLHAAQIILSRVWQARRSRPVVFDMPTIACIADLPAALAAVAAAVADGDLSPDEGASVVAVLEAQRRAAETVDLAARLAALEARTP